MDYDWQEDSRLLRLSEEDKRGLQGWLNMTKIIVCVAEEDNTEVGGLPEDLDPKQKLAYDIICNHNGGVIQDNCTHDRRARMYACLPIRLPVRVCLMFVK
jgi:hypothetical protein